jgi:YD repeat-containing protein
MNIKFYLALILALTGIGLTGSAQVSYNKRATGSIGTLPKASDFLNSASLDNVDMSTGTLKVGIPLYEIKVNDITIPISLNYSATGLKVGQEPGPTGMGWELSAGGKIIANVQGKKDPSGNNDLYSASWKDAVFNDYNAFNPYVSGYQYKAFLDGVLNGTADAAWDTYNYILPNGGGTFTRNGLTFPYDPSISIPYVGQIKTTDGLVYDFSSGETRVTSKRYYYDGSVTGVNSVSNQRNTSSDREATDQDLQRIISTKFKDTVNFTYDRFQAGVHDLSRRTRYSTSEMLPLYRDVRPRETDLSGIVIDGNDQWYKIMEPIINQNRTDVTVHTRISKISFPNGEVDFYYEELDLFGRDVLSNIKVFQKVGNTLNLLKRYVFDYDSDRTYGHYLSSLEIYDGKQVSQGSWDFTYNGKQPVVPGVENMAQDRWGFYNGRTANKTLLENPETVIALKTRKHYPIFNDGQKSNTRMIIYTRPDARQLYGDNLPGNQNGAMNFRIDFADRSTSFTSTQMGTLKSVKMPTGGKFEYAYDFNQFTYMDNAGTTPGLQYVPCGGLRITTITKSLGHDTLYNEHGLDPLKTLIKKYSYGSVTWAGSGSETLSYGTGIIPGTILGNISKYWDASNVTNDHPIENMMLLSHPVNSLTQYNGGPVMYTSVTESQVRNPQTGALSGKTVYFSDPLPQGYRSDAPWIQTYGTIESPQFPIMVISPGVESAQVQGISGIKKYWSTDSLAYPFKLIEQRKFYYQSFPAPQKSENKLISFFATLKGEMNGPFPVNTSQARNTVQNDPLGTGHVYLFNSFVSTQGVGLMDYLGYNNMLSEGNASVYPDKYQYDFKDLQAYSTCVRKIREEVVQWDDNELTLNLFNTNYYYDNPAHYLPTRVATVNTRGDSVITRTRYAADYTSGSITSIMKNQKLSFTDPIEEYVTYKPNSYINKSYYKSGTINTFKLVDGSVMNDKVYRMKINNDSTLYVPSVFSGDDGGIDTSVFKKQVSYDLYVKGNIHKYAELSSPGNVILWGYGNQYPIAKVSNTNNTSSTNDPNGWYTSADVAYTSFERTDKGNWSYAGVAVADTTGPSGKKIYRLENGSITKTNGTPSNVKYVISYWYKNGSTVNVSGGTAGAAVNKNTWGDWTMAERELTNVTGVVTVSGTGYIDELRFHPYDSQMSTYLYEPLIGVTGVIDAKGNLQYYEYDDSQRLRNIRDQKGNLVKSYRYQMGTLN